MSYKFVFTPEFEKEVLRLNQKFRNIKKDIEQLIDELSKEPKLGESLGKNTYKIRVKNSDINKGKRAGYRVITYVIDEYEKIKFITIYFKGEKEDISKNELSELIREYKNF